MRGLPGQPTPLIGRTTETAALRELLLREDVRLVTVTGAAGIGKTRLAIAAAADEDLQAAVPEGTVFVELSTIFDPARVLVSIARSFGLLDVTQATAVDRVHEVVRDRRVLLILDNFEHVLAAAADVATLLSNTDQLKLLVTSRAPLHIRWEHVFEAPPLELPDAVELFTERAQAAGASVPEDHQLIAELCLRLDRLPLALELAATRARVISAEAQLARMDHRLDLLAGGARDQPERQRTLREAIGWSYRLLPDAHRIVFRRLGVFVGGISLAAARAVVGSADDRSDLLTVLTELADHNLLRRESLSDGEPYFRMLETIREYALEQLAETGEYPRLQDEYARYWRDLAEAAHAELRGPGQLGWLKLLARERANLNATLIWCEQRPDQTELGLRLAAALSWFWYLRSGNRSEGREWLEHFAERAATSPALCATEARAHALSAAGLIAQYQLDLNAAVARQESALALGKQIGSMAVVTEALGRLAHLCVFRTEFQKGDDLARSSYELCRRLGDRWGVAFALSTRGLLARGESRWEDAAHYLQESLALFRQQGDRWGVAHVMLALGQVAQGRGDDAQAQECWEERLRLSREIGNQTGEAHTLDLLATHARQRGDDDRATSLLEQALALKRMLGDRQATAWALHGLGELALSRGELRTAWGPLEECLRLRDEIDDRPGLVATLVTFARLAAALGRPRRAARLAGAATALSAAIGSSMSVQHHSQGVLAATVAPSHPELDRALRRLGHQQRTEAWDEGMAMSLEHAIADALELGAELTQEVVVRRGSSELTRREREIAALLARGCSNREIAATLVITEGSAHVQVGRLLNKLGVHSRAQAAVWAATHEV